MRVRDPERPLSRWNRELNRSHPPDLFSRHRNPILRFVERRRRARLRSMAAARLKPGAGAGLVADVGSGGGFAGGAIADAGFGRRVVSLDIDPAMLSRGGAASVVADAEHLPFRERSLDALIASAVLEHLPDPAGALAGMARAVRRDGFVLLCVPNDRAVLAAKRAVRAARLARFFGGMTAGVAPGHLHVFSSEELRAMCRRAGRLETFVFDPIAFSWFAVVRPRG